jgi:hypothetical protein
LQNKDLVLEVLPKTRDKALDTHALSKLSGLPYHATAEALRILQKFQVVGYESRLKLATSGKKNTLANFYWKLE